jgi:hypothetical protein
MPGVPFRPPPPVYEWIRPTDEQLADGSGPWLEEHVAVAIAIIALLRRRAQDDADLAVGPLLGMLVLADVGVPQRAVEAYLATIADGDAIEAGALLGRAATVREALGDREAELDEYWAGVVDLMRSTLGPSAGR